MSVAGLHSRVTDWKSIAKTRRKFVACVWQRTNAHLKHTWCCFAWSHHKL